MPKKEYTEDELRELEKKVEEKRDIMKKAQKAQKDYKRQLEKQNREKSKKMEPVLGRVIRLILDRDLTDEDYENLYYFLMGQEKRSAKKEKGPGHFFTNFMNDSNYRENQMRNSEYIGMSPPVPREELFKAKKISQTDDEEENNSIRTGPNVQNRQTDPYVQPFQPDQNDQNFQPDMDGMNYNGQDTLFHN